ncbi:MAG: hypothetical protein ABMB14_22285 [Myxococcota bacterium]
MSVWWLVTVAFAQDPLAEKQRLEDELVKLAQRNTWTGVDRTYRRLIELDVALSPEDHYLAARAAFAAGQTGVGWFRLRRALATPEPSDPVQVEARLSAERESAALADRFGLVSIYVGQGAVPVLYREAMPFSQQERDAIVAAQKAVSAGHGFRGYLPVGSYALDTVRFEVVANDDWLVVTAGVR